MEYFLWGAIEGFETPGKSAYRGINPSSYRHPLSKYSWSANCMPDVGLVSTAHLSPFVSLYSSALRWAAGELDNYHMQVLSVKGKVKQGKGIENCYAYGGVI